MKVTSISKIGKDDKFAVFVDDKLTLFLNGQLLLDSSLSTGSIVDKADLKRLKELSDSNKLYNRTLKYISLRLRSEGEVIQYLKRKGATKQQIIMIINKLKDLELINDDNFVRAFIHDKTMVTPASKRKIAYELRKKQIAEEVIERSLSGDQINDLDSLLKTIKIKRRQPKFSDNLKLMQYLSRVGYNYSDIKEALTRSDED